MRFALTILCLIHAGHAVADQMDQAIAMARANTLPIVWKNGDGEALLPPLHLDLAAPGRLILTRDLNANTHQSYALEAVAFQRPKGISHLRVKSTTCAGIRPQLRCHLVSDLRAIEFEARPLNGGPALQPFMLTNATVAKDVSQTLLPDLAPEFSTTLHCNDWAWATSAQSGHVEVQDVGLVLDQTLTDVRITLPATSQLSGSLTCPAKANQGCQIISSDEPRSMRGFILHASTLPWYLELTDAGGKDCTVEFQSSDDRFADFIRNQSFGTDGRRILSAAERQRIQSYLTPQLINGWIRSQIYAAFNDPKPFESKSGAEQLSLVRLPWLNLFDMISDHQIKTPAHEYGATPARYLLINGELKEKQ